MHPLEYDTLSEDWELLIGAIGAVGDTMQVIQDIGPAAPQLNIPAAFTQINDIQIISPVAGHALIVAHSGWENMTAGNRYLHRIYRNGVFLPLSHLQFIGVAGGWTEIRYSAWAITDLAIGDVLTLHAFGDGAADLSTDSSGLALITA